MNRLHSDIDTTTDRLSSQAGQAIDDSLDATQRVARRSLDRLSETVDDMRDQMSPRLHRMADEAGRMARRGSDAALDSAQRLRERALQASDQTIRYVRHEPVKSALIAVAAGAALMALFSMMNSRSRRWD